MSKSERFALRFVYLLALACSWSLAYDHSERWLAWLLLIVGAGIYGVCLL